MSDNMRRFRSIKNGLMKLLPRKPKGNFARHFETMAFMINGVIGSRSCNLPKVASKVADLRKPESRVRTFTRWLSNKRIDFTLYYLPSHTKVVFLGDGEFDGSDLITRVKSFGWLFVCRTAKNRKLLENGAAPIIFKKQFTLSRSRSSFKKSSNKRFKIIWGVAISSAPFDHK